MALDLTTTARVKSMLDPSYTATDLDALIAVLITAVSAAAEKEMDREALTNTYTEFFSPQPFQTKFPLAAFPVVSVVSVKEDFDRGFGSGIAALDDTDFTIDDLGILTVDNYRMAPGNRTMRVVYSGGMATTAAAFVTAFPDVAFAVDMQVAFLVRRKNQLGVTSQAIVGAAFTVFAAVEWLPQAREILAQRRRSIAW